MKNIRPYAPLLLAAMLLVGISGSSAVGFYYGLFEPSWLTYRNLPFPVIKKQVKAGEAVELRVVRCNADKKRRIYAITRTLVADKPSDSIMLPADIVSIAPGCTSETSAVNVVPVTAKPGGYHIEGTAEVRGIIRTIIVDWSSEPFEVVP